MHFACTRPQDLQAPSFVETTNAVMTLEWSTPSDNGGCPITGFYLMRDDQQSGLMTIEVPEVTRDQPSLKEASIALSDLGNKYTF